MQFKMQYGTGSVCAMWTDPSQFYIAVDYLQDHVVQHELICPESVSGFAPQLSAPAIQIFPQHPC